MASDPATPIGIDLDSTPNDPEQLKHLVGVLIGQRDTLAQAIADAAHKAGIVNSEVGLTPPQLLQLCQDLGASARLATSRFPGRQLPGLKAAAFLSVVQIDTEGHASSHIPAVSRTDPADFELSPPLPPGAVLQTVYLRAQSSNPARQTAPLFVPQFEADTWEAMGHSREEFLTKMQRLAEHMAADPHLLVVVERNIATQQILSMQLALDAADADVICGDAVTPGRMRAIVKMDPPAQSNQNWILGGAVIAHGLTSLDRGFDRLEGPIAGEDGRRNQFWIMNPLGEIAEDMVLARAMRQTTDSSTRQAHRTS